MQVQLEHGHDMYSAIFEFVTGPFISNRNLS